MMTHWFTYNFAPAHEPWYHGNIYGNMWAWILCGALAAMWIRAKFIAVHNKLREHKHMLEEIHHKVHTGKDHPRVVARLSSGKHPTPGMSK
jgi:hypothetical protein